MKAIETRYKGYRFRSRLEARWAVFFDALGLGWQYEPEGYVLKVPYSRFELPSEVRYLPDFYIPELSLWVEVKGERISWPDPALEKAEALRDHTNQGVIVVGTDPADAYPWIGFDVGDSSGGASTWHEACFGLKDGTPVLVDCVPVRDREYFNGGDFEYPLVSFSDSLLKNKQFLKCVTAFRSARFEHGECGAPA